ncbi:hypothetical protein GGTG_06844 [Gaeumannomyces tritici R3-111a-1]|uniref:Uncharacterized protein n=1 Tax=Gaeumannomyces tritici (strain R3-111a-1) TaxID=644352 RepID=J3NZZ7_GAET3|nr:hypothetical protein GGTG_06844 [Gaeumannomyces tritici R3-111a-1]EJT76930.1 hypothetical protein GGTG_06844 [Gaeumannomyces tritici R3-111a-1]
MDILVQSLYAGLYHKGYFRILKGSDGLQDCRLIRGGRGRVPTPLFCRVNGHASLTWSKQDVRKKQQETREMSKCRSWAVTLKFFSDEEAGQTEGAGSVVGEE